MSSIEVKGKAIYEIVHCHDCFIANKTYCLLVYDFRLDWTGLVKKTKARVARVSQYFQLYQERNDHQLWFENIYITFIRILFLELRVLTFCL